MEFNQSRVLASDLYLVEKWTARTSPSTQRRNEILLEFVALGMRGRWPWHARAEKVEFNQFTAEEKKLLEYRDWSIRSIAGWIGGDLRRVVVTTERDLSLLDLRFRTDWEGDDMLVCRHDGDPYEVLPEVVYSMTAFDEPDDVEEARQSQRDQSLWVSGVFWIDDKILWVDEYGKIVREKVCNLQDREKMGEGAEPFERFRPFESIWWTQAVAMGKYARDEWWV